MEVEQELPQLETEGTSSSKVQPTNSEKNWLFRYHGIASGIILLVAVLLRFSSQEGGMSVAIRRGLSANCIGVSIHLVWPHSVAH